MKQRLITTPAHLARAFGAGLLVAYAFCLPVALRNGVTMGKEQQVPPVGSALVMALAALLVLATPVWIVLYVFGRRRLTAALAGAVAIALFVFFPAAAAIDEGLTFSRVLHTAYSALGAALVFWTLWTLAYPRSLQPPPPQTHF